MSGRKSDGTELLGLAVAAVTVVLVCGAAVRSRVVAAPADDEDEDESSPAAVIQRTATSMEVPERSCPPATLCPVVVRAPQGPRTIVWDPKGPTLLLDGPRLASIDHGKFTDLGAPSGVPLAAGIVHVRADKKKELVVIDGFHDIYRRILPRPRRDEAQPNASPQAALAFEKIGKLSSDPIHSRPFLLEEPKPTGLAFSGDELWAFSAGHIQRQTKEGMEEIALPGFGDDPSGGTIENVRERTRRTRVSNVRVAFRAPGDAIISYYEPNSLTRPVARAFAWDHGLSTELFGAEDTEITEIAPGAPGELYFAAKESHGKDAPPTWFIGLHRNGVTERLHEGSDPVVGLASEKGDACFVVAKPDGAVEWSTTRDRKVQDTRIIDLLPGQIADGARCRGDRRLTVTGGAWVMDFDGQRTAAVKLEDVHDELGRIQAMFVERPGVWQLMTDSGVFRVNGAVVEKLSDQINRRPGAVWTALDGAGYARFESQLFRWDGAAWSNPRQIPSGHQVLYVAPGNHVVATSVLYESRGDLYLDDKPWPGWKPQKWEPVAAFGTIEEAWIAATGIDEEEGGLFHWDGKAFTRVDGIPPLRTVFGRSMDDAWAVGHDKIFHFDGARWDTATTVAASFYPMQQAAGRPGHALLLGAEGLFDLSGGNLELYPYRSFRGYGPGTIAFEPGAAFLVTDDVVYRVADKN